MKPTVVAVGIVGAVAFVGIVAAVVVLLVSGGNSGCGKGGYESVAYNKTSDGTMANLEFKVFSKSKYSSFTFEEAVAKCEAEQAQLWEVIGQRKSLPHFSHCEPFN